MFFGVISPISDWGIANSGISHEFEDTSRPEIFIGRARCWDNVGTNFEKGHFRKGLTSRILGTGDAQKSQTSHPFEGAILPSVQRARFKPGESRFLRHAQWTRCDTRAIIRARRLDTFNCHVNLFVPLPIEGGRALSRESSPGEKSRARADDTQWAIHSAIPRS